MSAPNLPRMHYEPWRAVVFYLVLAVAFGWLIFRLFGLQVLEFGNWKAQADENRTRAISVPPSRGIIYDRRGYILARNVASFNIVITPADLPNDLADIQEIYRQLSELTGIPVNSGTVEDAKLVSPCVPGPGIAQWVALGDSLAPYSPVRIDCNISEDMARTVREKSVDWPGVSVEIEPVRDYPTGSLTANIIGFLGPIPASPATLEAAYRERGFLPNRDKVGYSGVEAYFDNELLGTPGRRVAEVDVAGQVLRNLELPIAPVAGNNLTLTIDTRLQKAAEGALVGEINEWNAFFQTIRISSGAIVALNPKTGEVLAMVSYPTYENNRLARIIPAYYYQQLAQDPRKPLLNHAISSEYPPGSVFKLSAAIGSLNEQVVTPTTIIETPGELVVTEEFAPNSPTGFAIERRFVDHIFDQNPGGFGQLDFLHCIAYSSNVCFYKLGGGWKTEIREGLAIDRLGEYARALGYDEASGIELLGETDGLMPTRQWKRINQGENWSTGDTYIATVGQGYVLATPLQVLMSAATIANDGKLMQPTIVRELTDSNGKIFTLWRDKEGDFYHPCNVTDADGQPVSGWCDSNYDFTNKIVYRLCDGENPEGKTVSGWCGEDDQKTPIFKEGAWQISPNLGHLKWDLTVDNLIQNYQCEGGFCALEEGKTKPVESWVIEKVQEGMRLAVTDSRGTLNEVFGDMSVAVAGKTGTAEYCDDVARANNRCDFGLWPTHSWTVAYAPYDDPEIAVVAFAYNGGEGASVAAPMVRLVMDAYFCLKSVDLNPNTLTGCE
jgi:penicillin-binding protein 2